MTPNFRDSYRVIPRKPGPPDQLILAVPPALFPLINEEQIARLSRQWGRPVRVVETKFLPLS